VVTTGEIAIRQTIRAQWVKGVVRYVIQEQFDSQKRYDNDPCVQTEMMLQMGNHLSRMPVY
jgi:hypothetical protein